MTAYDIDKSGRLVRNSPRAGRGPRAVRPRRSRRFQGDPRNPKSVAADAFDRPKRPRLRREPLRSAGRERPPTRGDARRRDDGRLARGHGRVQ